MAVGFALLAYMIPLKTALMENMATDDRADIGHASRLAVICGCVGLWKVLEPST